MTTIQLTFRRDVVRLLAIVLAAVVIIAIALGLTFRFRALRLENEQLRENIQILEEGLESKNEEITRLIEELRTLKINYDEAVRLLDEYKALVDQHRAQDGKHYILRLRFDSALLSDKLVVDSHYIETEVSKDLYDRCVEGANINDIAGMHSYGGGLLQGQVYIADKDIDTDEDA